MKVILFRPTELQFPGKFGNAKRKKGTEYPSRNQKDDNSTQPRNSQVIPHTKIRKSIAEHMVFSKRTSPHVTTVMEVDLSKSYHIVKQ